MPDPLKLATLEAAGYRIAPVCDSCAYFRFEPGGRGRVSSQRATPVWGSCAKLTPAHTRHTDGGRISARSDGTCPSHAITMHASADLARSGFDRFLAVPDPVRAMGVSPVMCRQGCGREVETARRCYATPVCYACLPPPPALMCVSCGERHGGAC